MLNNENITNTTIFDIMAIKIITLTAIILLAGCQTYQESQSRRSKIAQFILNHPVAAQAIGAEDAKSSNISSNAARFAKRTGLDNSRNGDGRATEVNAVQQALWQAAISAKFDDTIAEQAGNAYLLDTEYREGKTDYYSRLAADQAVDLRNNRIGRSIGSGKPAAEMKDLALSVLLYYHKIGLWTAEKTTVDGRKIWRISQTPLSEPAYLAAVGNLQNLNANGMTLDEEYTYKPDKLRDIRKSVKAFSKVQD